MLALDYKSDEYKTEEEYDLFHFSYFKISTEREDYFKLSQFKTIKSNKMPIPISKSSIPLPMNMDYENWGQVILQQRDKLVVLSGNILYKISFHKDQNIITVYKNQNLSYEIIDQKVKVNKNELNQYFTRKFEDTTYYCRVEDKEPLLTVRNINTTYMEPIKKEVVHTDPKIATLNIKTLLKDGIRKPYLYSFYDGEEEYSWLENNAMNLFKHILRRKYDGYQVYAHDLDKFDIVFLLEDLAKLTSEYNINIIKRDSKYIMIKITHKTKRISITLKDSYHILPSTLEDLASQFHIDKYETIIPVLQNNYKAGKWENEKYTTWIRV